jgi:hypothetical protein
MIHNTSVYYKIIPHSDWAKVRTTEHGDIMCLVQEDVWGGIRMKLFRSIYTSHHGHVWSGWFNARDAEFVPVPSMFLLTNSAKGV